MGKTKFGTKIVFFFVILLGAGAVLYAKNCMEQLAAYAVSLVDGAGQAQAQSQLAAMIASDVKKMAAFMAAGLIITIVVGAAGIIDYIRSLDLACSYSDALAQGDLTQDVEQKYLDSRMLGAAGREEIKGKVIWAAGAGRWNKKTGKR